MKFELGKVHSNPYARAFKPQQVVEADGDHEVKMAEGQLEYIIKSATELKGKLGGIEKNIPGWIQDHISKAHSYLHQANSGYHELGETETVNEATTLQKIFRKIGWGGDGWTPQDYAKQIKDLPDSTLKLWYDSAKNNKGISNTPLAFQQKLTKIEMEKRGLIESTKLKNAANLVESKKNLYKKGDIVNYIPKLSGFNPKTKLKISNVVYVKGDEFTKPGWYYTFDGTNLRANEKDIKSVSSIKESTEEPKIITQLRDVMKSGYKKLKDPKSGKAMTVDSYSASAIVKVYDALKDPKNKEKFSSAGLLGMQSMAFKLIK
jgi:hypothetical protein